MDTKEPVFMPSRTSVKLANKRCAMGSSPAPQSRAEENEKQAAPKQEGKAKSREVTRRVSEAGVVGDSERQRQESRQSPGRRRVSIEG